MSEIDLPSEFNYSNNKRTTMSGIEPMYKKYNSDFTSYTPSSEIKISIPPSNNTHSSPTDNFVLGTLNFTVDAAGTATLDSNIYSLFEKMRVEQGGVNVEEVSVGFGKLCHVINDCTRNHTDRQNDSINLLAASTAVLGADACGGVYLPSLKGVVGTNATYALQFCFQLPSSLVGSMADHSLPLGWISNANLDIVLTLASQNNMFATFATAPVITAVTISNVYYYSKEVRLPPSIDQALYRQALSQDGTIKIPGYQWRVYNKPSVAAGVTSFEERFPIAHSSVNFVLWWIHNSAAQNSQTYRSQTSRPHHGVSSWTYKINGLQYPSQPIEGRAQNLYELSRCFDYLSLTRGLGILDSVNYMNTGDDNLVASDANTTGITHKRTVYGHTFSKTNSSGETSFDGENLNGTQFSISCTNKTAVAQAFDIYCAAYIDCVYQIQNGSISVLL